MPTPRVRCPTCQRQVDFTPDSQFRPFCSERCRMVDLGAWFAEERTIAGDGTQALDEPGDDNAPRPPARN